MCDARAVRYFDSVDDASNTFSTVYCIRSTFHYYTDCTNTTSYTQPLHQALAHPSNTLCLFSPSPSVFLSIEVHNRPSRNLSPLQLLYRLWQLIDRIDRINRLQKSPFRKVQRLRRVFHVADECTGDGKVLEGEERRVSPDGRRACRCCIVGIGLASKSKVCCRGKGSGVVLVDEGDRVGDNIRNPIHMTFAPTRSPTRPIAPLYALGAVTMTPCAPTPSAILTTSAATSLDSLKSTKASAPIFMQSSFFSAPVSMTMGRSPIALASCTPWMPTPPPPPGKTAHSPGCSLDSTSERYTVLAEHMIGPAMKSSTPSGMGEV